MTHLPALEGLIERLPWTPHVHREGSREHVMIVGVYDDGETVMPITWCTCPFCQDNRSMVEYIVDRGFDPIDMQPPPKLREALRSLTKLEG